MISKTGDSSPWRTYIPSSEGPENKQINIWPAFMKAIINNLKSSKLFLSKRKRGCVIFDGEGLSGEVTFKRFLELSAGDSRAKTWGYGFWRGADSECKGLAVGTRLCYLRKSQEVCCG